VGPATARAIERMGWAVELLPEKYVAESLLEALGDRLRGRRVLLARSARARDVIPDSLRAQGIDVTVVDAYRTEIPRESIEKVRELFGSEGARLDAATFTSSSTVENFLELVRAAQATAPPVALPAISIGPITSRTLCDAGWPPVAEADPHTVDGLVAAVLKVLSQRSAISAQRSETPHR
jgi:uroporphyrinogen-III synthase